MPTLKCRAPAACSVSCAHRHAIHGAEIATDVVATISTKAEHCALGSRKIAFRFDRLPDAADESGRHDNVLLNTEHHWKPRGCRPLQGPIDLQRGQCGSGCVLAGIP